MTMIGRPLCSVTSKIVTMFGVPERRAAASASRSNRARSDRSWANRADRTFSATSRPSSLSVAQKTSAMPPVATRRPSR